MSITDQLHMGPGRSISRHDHKHPLLRERTLTLALRRNSLETGGAIDDRVSASGTRRPRGGIGSALHRSMVCAVLLTLGVPSTARAQQEPFTMIIMNDPQITWWDTAPVPELCNPLPWGLDLLGYYNLTENYARVLTILHFTKNEWIEDHWHWRNTSAQYWPIEVGGGSVQKPVAVIINGDLTSCWGARWTIDDMEQKGWYRRFYHTEHITRTRVLPGLGNHDYQDNRFSDGSNPLDAVAFMREAVTAGGVGNFPGYWVTNYDHKSMSYSWDYGSYHFVQLHHGADDGIDAGYAGVQDYTAWLTHDLARATTAGKKIVLNHHGISSLPSLSNYNVVAIFKGHAAYDPEDYPDDPPEKYLGRVCYEGSNAFGESIPVFQAGHAGELLQQSKLLLVEFGEAYMRVGTIAFMGRFCFECNANACKWKLRPLPQFFRASEEKYLKKYPLQRTACNSRYGFVAAGVPKKGLHYHQATFEPSNKSDTGAVNVFYELEGETWDDYEWPSFDQQWLQGNLAPTTPYVADEPETLKVLNHNETNNFHGYALATGDFNGDGYPDLWALALREKT